MIGYLDGYKPFRKCEYDVLKRATYSPFNIRWHMTLHFYCANSMHDVKVHVSIYVEWTIMCRNCKEKLL